MGYSITWEQHEKLEKNRRDGRLCQFSTGRGGCFTRATTKVTQDSWNYATEKDAGETPHVHVMTLCTRHAMPVGYEGMNFTVTATEKF